MAPDNRHVPRLLRQGAGSTGAKLALLVVLAAALQLAAGAGMAYVAGFGAVERTLDDARWAWSAGVVSGLVLALVGTYYATSGIYQVDDGVRLTGRQLRSVVVASFGGFLAHGGSGLDKYAIRAAGGDEGDGAVRVAAYAGLEHGVLSLYGTVAGIVVLVTALSVPPLDFSLPWAVIPLPGFLLAFLCASRFEPRLREKRGWRHHVWTFLRAVLLVRRLFTRDVLRHTAVFGMALFWGAELFSIWSGLALFGFRMNVAQLILGAGTGMLFTRRTGPVAGAGVLEVTLSASIWYSGAPLAVAVVGVFAYRVLALWLPMPAGLAQVPTLRRIGIMEVPGAEGRAGGMSEPALPG